MSKKDWQYGLDEVLITEKQIQERIKELGKEITLDFKQDETPFIVVCILKGSVIFMADLVRQIHLNLAIDFMEVSSYGDGFENTRNINILKDLSNDIEGKNILIVEDIIDSGLTLQKIVEVLNRRNPKSITLCTLLDKKERREVDIEVKYVGFDIPDKFVTGYGLDFKQEYRNIPYVGVMDISKIEI